MTKQLRASLFQVFFLFGLLMAIKFFPMLFMGKTLFFGDNYSLMVPGKLFTVHWLKQGVLPLWNPNLFTGLSWIGDVNQSVLYPSTLLFLFLSPAVALNLTVLSHLLITMVGMYFLTKWWTNNHSLALLGAVMWTLSPQVTSAINNLSMIQSLSWMPLIVYLGLRLHGGRWARYLFPVLIVLQFAGGYPQHVIYSILLAVLFSGFFTLLKHSSKPKMRFNNWLRTWLVTGVLTLAITAVIWLPFLEVLLASTRTIQLSIQSLAGSFHPIELIKLVLPYFFDNPQLGMRWGPGWNQSPNMGLYFSWLGLCVLILSLIKKKKIVSELFLIMVFLVSLVLSLGRYLPGFEVLQLLGISRIPSLWLAVTTLVGVLWICSSLDKLKFFNQQLRWLKWAISLVFGTALILVAVTRFSFNGWWQWLDRFSGGFLTASSFHTLARDQLIVKSIVTNLLINSGMFGLVMVVFSWKKPRNIKMVVLAVIIGLDLIWNTQQRLFFAPNKIYTPRQEVISLIETTEIQSGQRLLIRNSNHPYTDFGMYWEALMVRQPFSDSFVDQSELESYQHLQRMATGLTPGWSVTTQTRALNGYTTLLPQTVNQTWNQTSELSINSLPEIKLNEPLLKQWAVQYYLVDNWFQVEEDLSVFKIVAQQEPWAIYELPDTLDRIRFANGSPTSVNNLAETPNRLEFSIDNLSQARSLIVADRYDSNWQAWVNGQPRQIIDWQGMQVVSIEPGKNNIKFIYWPKMFYLGLIISGISWLVLGWVVVQKKYF